MAQQNCGASVYAVMMRLAVLEQDGVPLPGARNLYVTDALVKLTATPVYYQSPVVEIPNASGALCVNLNTRKVLKWYDLALEICNLDPEVDNMLVGGETFSSAGFVIGGSVPAAGAISAPFGVSVELWSKHIVGSDQDTVWPYIQWILPRTYWSPDAVTWDINHQARMFQGFTSENPNWYNGPANDWTFASDRSIAWRFTKTVPPSACGAQALASS
jgi:hypothetical protein